MWMRKEDFADISTHAPAQGATWTDIGDWVDDKDFNPRSPTGSDANAEK